MRLPAFTLTQPFDAPARCVTFVPFASRASTADDVEAFARRFSDETFTYDTFAGAAGGGVDTADAPAGRRGLMRDADTQPVRDPYVTCRQDPELAPGFAVSFPARGATTRTRG